MSEKHKPVNRRKPATFNIITSDDDVIVSVTMTRRHPSPKEVELCDHYEQMYVGGVGCHFVMRGLWLTVGRLGDMAERLLALTIPWEDGDVVTVETPQIVINKDDDATLKGPGIDFANDKTWQRIMAISGGAR